MAVPKKRMSKAKKRNRKSIWKTKALSTSLRAYSTACSLEKIENQDQKKITNFE